MGHAHFGGRDSCPGNFKKAPDECDNPRIESAQCRWLRSDEGRTLAAWRYLTAIDGARDVEIN